MITGSSCPASRSATPSWTLLTHSQSAPASAAIRPTSRIPCPYALDLMTAPSFGPGPSLRRNSAMLRRSTAASISTQFSIRSPQAVRAALDDDGAAAGSVDQLRARDRDGALLRIDDVVVHNVRGRLERREPHFSAQMVAPSVRPMKAG